MEIMKSMPDESVDVCITDPPYGDKTHEGARTGVDGDVVLVPFASISRDEFIDATREIVRVTRRWVVMTCEWRYISALEEAGLPLVRFGVWVKPNGMPQYSGDRPSTGWEAIAILHRPGRKTWKGGGRHAVWTYNKQGGEHPTQKPIPLIKDFMYLFSEEGEIVFDPYCGAGTTCVVAKEMGRRFIGIEVNPEYAAIAQRRVDSVGHQIELF